jgi:hypothetical protein
MFELAEEESKFCKRRKNRFKKEYKKIKRKVIY